MNSYQFPIPRAAFGTVAVAMTVITFALLVALPAASASGSHAARAAAVAKVDAPVGTDGVSGPLRVDVFGTRDQTTAFERVREVTLNAKQPG